MRLEASITRGIKKRSTCLPRLVTPAALRAWSQRFRRGRLYVICMGDCGKEQSHQLLPSMTSPRSTARLFAGWLLACHEQEGVFVFAADSDLRLAAECNTLVSDATYKASPKGLYQLYTLHAKFASPSGGLEWIAVAFALMGLKFEAAHAIVFDAILLKWAELGCHSRFTKFLVDFDSAQLEAVAAAFGMDKLRAFASYMRRFWFGEVPLMWWNYWTMETYRTMNAAEAFHSMLSKQQTTLAHPSLTNFLPWLQELHSWLQTRIVQLQAGAKTRPKDQRYVQLDDRIDKYKTNFRHKLLGCPDMGS
uniref:MULE transposase domain-containing protein n=1 Tax=Plectus sambesii TaxID=2011161 RepID=A0A914WZK9_9BILA